jgi:hypothetical protein
LRDTQRSPRLSKRLLTLSRRRRRRISKNTKNTKTSAKRPNLRLLFPQLQSMMPPLPSRTKENIKFKSPT